MRLSDGIMAEPLFSVLHEAHSKGVWCAASGWRKVRRPAAEAGRCRTAGP